MEKITKLKLFFKAFYKIPLLIPSWSDKELSNAYPGTVKDSEKLKEKIKSMYNIKYAFDFNLGRSAMQIALRSFCLSRNDEVILSTYSCRGVIEPIIREGLKPVLVDIDNNFNISPESIERSITKKTKVIIMSHLYGRAAQIEKILAIAKKHNLYVIDDAAQVVGLKHKNKMVGTFGDIGILSFGIGKSISATGGGILITNNKYFANIASLNWALSKLDINATKGGKFNPNNRYVRYFDEYYMRKFTAPFFLIFNKFEKKEEWNIKKMDYFDCSLAISQLNKLNKIIRLRELGAKDYSKLFKGRLQWLLWPPELRGIFTKYVITIRSYDQEHNLSRYLRLHRIETETNYKPLHLYSEYKNYIKYPAPLASVIYKRVLTIPNHHLMNHQDRVHIANKLSDYFDKGERFD
jgi:dTDP-4-amino-4,6-dideoxygalactose transaminase